MVYINRNACLQEQPQLNVEGLALECNVNTIDETDSPESKNTLSDAFTISVQIAKNEGKNESFFVCTRNAITFTIF